MDDKGKPMKCRRCNTDAERDTLEDAVRSLRACNNCRSDIALRGEWTGKGMEAIDTLVKRFGRDAIMAAWEAAVDEDKRRKKKDA